LQGGGGAGQAGAVLGGGADGVAGVPNQGGLDKTEDERDQRRGEQHELEGAAALLMWPATTVRRSS
jgi:hypothetical protein